MIYFLFLLAALATFRLTRLITDDKITAHLRNLVVRKAPPPLKKKTRQGITCPFCVSLYVSTLVIAYLYIFGDLTIPETFLWIPATWGASVILNQLFVFLSPKS